MSYQEYRSDDTCIYLCILILAFGVVTSLIEMIPSLEGDWWILLVVIPFVLIFLIVSIRSYRSSRVVYTQTEGSRIERPREVDCEDYGLKDVKPDSYFNKRQLVRGIEVELEHTDNVDMAKCIAKRHLSESEDYYVELDKMEKRLKE